MKAPLKKSDPEAIGPYRLIARLGSGGMGIVYLATKGAQSVALKVLNQESLESPQAKSRFLKEVESLSQVSSEFVAKVVNSDTEEEFSWLAVEFVNGPDLKELIEDRGPLPLEEWIRFAHGLLSGIAAIHSQGLIHRDIKPGNIVIADSGPKIIDFGISQDLDATSLTMTGSVAGSPAWLSPEQIDGKKLTYSSDLFSAGSVLHFAATGMAPWGDESTTTTSAVFNRILFKDPDTSKLQGVQKLVIEALLEKVTANRATAHEALSILKSQSDGDEDKSNNITSDILTQEAEKTDKGSKARASASNKDRGAFLAATILIALIAGFVVLQSSEATANYLCSETSYSAEDLSEASFQDLSSASLDNVLSRECVSWETLDYEFKVEYCKSRDRDSGTPRGSPAMVRQITQKETIPRNITFSGEYGSTYGCRSFVQMGKMDQQESRSTMLGFSTSTSVNSYQRNLLRSGSIFETMSDGLKGAFVTRFYASIEKEATVPLSYPAIRPLQLSVTYASGDISYWDSGPEYAKFLWKINDLQADTYNCITPDTPAQLELLKDGVWISLASNSEVIEHSCGSDAPLLVTTNDVLSNFEVGTCNQVKLKGPGSATLFCFELKELSVAETIEAGAEQAKSYFDCKACRIWSRESLIGMLMYGGYHREDSEIAVNSLGLDWSEQAVLAANDYIKSPSFLGSREDIVMWLVDIDEFTQEEAEYGATEAGY